MATHTFNPGGHQIGGMHDIRNCQANPGVVGRPLVLANGILSQNLHVLYHDWQQLHRKIGFGDVYSQISKMPVLLA